VFYLRYGLNSKRLGGISVGYINRRAKEYAFWFIKRNAPAFNTVNRRMKQI
jgi:hypothetical protein